MKAPQDVLADVAIFRAALGVAQIPAERKVAGPQAAAPGTQPVELSVQAPEGQPVADFNAYARTVKSAFKQSGLPPKLAAWQTWWSQRS